MCKTAGLCPDELHPQRPHWLRRPIRSPHQFSLAAGRRLKAPPLRQPIAHQRLLQHPPRKQRKAESQTPCETCGAVLLMVAKIFEVSALCKQVAKCNRCFVAHGLALHVSSSLRGGDRCTKPAQTRHMCETNPKAHMSIRQPPRARRTQCVKLPASLRTDAE